MKFLREIKIKEISYKVYETEEENRPYQLVDENNNKYWAFLRNLNATNFHIVDWGFKTKFSIPREELQNKIDEREEPIVLTPGSTLTWSSTGWALSSSNAVPVTGSSSIQPILSRSSGTPANNTSPFATIFVDEFGRAF